MDTTSNQKKGRSSPRKGGSNRSAVVDVVIILLAVVALAGVFFRWVFATAGEDRTHGDKTYIVSVEIAEAHKTTLESLRAGDTLYLADDASYTGYFVSTPTVLLRPTEGALPNRAVATARLSCEGVLGTDGTLTLTSGDICLSPGSELEVRTDRALLSLRVVKIELKN